MATLNAKVFKYHYKKSDGTYNVKIVLYHGTSVYLDTEHYVVDKQLTKSFKIKDQFVQAQLGITLSKYRKAISELGEKINALSADSLKQHLIGSELKVDFFKFSEEYITGLKSKEETEKSGFNFNTVRNHLLDFNDHNESLPIEFISVDFISRFEKFLRRERTPSIDLYHSARYTSAQNKFPNRFLCFYSWDKIRKLLSPNECFHPPCLHAFE